MVESIEIDLILEDTEASAVLDKVHSHASDIDGYLVEWYPNEKKRIYISHRLNDQSFGLSVTANEDDDPEWYTLPSRSAIGLQVQTEDLSGYNAADERVSMLLDIVETVYTASDDYIYGYGLDTEHVGSIGENWGPDKPVTNESIANNRIADVSWLMLFAPELVDEYGREWLLSTPTWKHQEFDDGGIMLVASPDPTDYDTFTEGREYLREYFDFR